ncbi:unnamed protein product [Discula destructiva]
MSPTMTMAMHPAMYTPTADVMERHEYGITKHSRKTSSTGGGRAWSEDEEVYLLQTRLQKMPYKHIAAHLKKTELACRLHYHQLSHGSNRRKRMTSMSSGSSSSGHSPLMMASIPSPIRESSSRSVSPTGSLASYGQGGVQLPSIMNASPHHSNSPRLPAILPKPANMSLPLSSSRYTSLHDHAQHSAPLLPSASFHAAAHHHSPAGPRSAAMAPLRLDCSRDQSAAPQQTVDTARLHTAYNNHRNAFWSAVAADYGSNVHPSALEQAWRTGGSAASGSVSSKGYAAPITPISSPDGKEAAEKQSKTRISAILGIDANPMSPDERAMVRRIEEERAMIGVGA